MRARARSMKAMRDAGYLTGSTEHFNPHIKIRKDLFGFIDFQAIKPGEPIIAVQVCWKDWPKHIVSVAFNPAARVWLQAGGRIVIHSWALRGKRGARKKWELDVTRMEIIKGEVLPVPF